MIRSPRAQKAFELKQGQIVPQYGITSAQLYELSRARADASFFANNFCEFNSFMTGLQPLTLYPYQVTQLGVYDSPKNIICVQPRQTGASLMLVVVALWTAIFKSNQTVVLACTTDAIAAFFMDRLVTMYDQLPTWLRPRDVRRTSGVLELDNGSRVFVRGIHSGNMLRGLRISKLLLDNFGGFDDALQLEFLTSVIPAVDQTIISGQPTKPHNPFHVAWTNAPLSGQYSWETHHIKPTDCPQLDAATLAGARQLLGSQTYRRQFEGDFDA